MALESAAGVPIVDVTEKIHEVRGLRVILDTDLAAIYGVTTLRLNEQVKRNQKRFPQDFSFVLAPQEVAILKSQNAISSLRSHGGRRQPPIAFTEYGALMAANVLKSDRAAEMSVFVIRAFVRMREVLLSNSALAAKLNELEQRVSGHDNSIAEIISAIRQLINTDEDARPKREIGFHVKNSRAKNLKAS